MEHLTAEKYDKICAASTAYSNCFTGSRQQEKAYNEMFINLARKMSTKCEKAPKKYCIYFTENKNLGTRKWMDRFVNAKCEPVDKETLVRETEKSIILEEVYNERYTRKVIINKEKILCYVW